ncbi:MAG: response regulator [Pseudobdellovibrionaceae bacterium]|uniref:response regulator n=1 Tax=Oligoflexus sp. TaxID=1971216 RepID=UPI0027C3C719|nr:response regulator [Oligoflexus sp.]MDQ3232244.1 response regulator [Pseudobdellovibrionaceae bacterium]HYX38233.1 response regulator [Oligoflexus sp.]
MGRILAVDDSEVILAELQTILKKDGHEVFVAPNGAAGVAMAQQVAPLDVIITDFNMPEMNGVELTQAIKKDSRFSQTSIVMLTTENSTELRKQGLDAGVRVWIVKPVHGESLCKVIGKLLKPKAA